MWWKARLVCLSSVGVRMRGLWLMGGVPLGLCFIRV